MPRFTIDVDDKFDKLLTDLAASRNSSKAETIRAAVASYKFLKGQIEENPDLKVSITNKKDDVLKDVELP